MVSKSTGVAGGKKLKNTDRVKKMDEKALTTTPALPIRKGPMKLRSVCIRAISLNSDQSLTEFDVLAFDLLDHNEDYWDQVGNEESGLRERDNSVERSSVRGEC